MRFLTGIPGDVWKQKKKRQMENDKFYLVKAEDSYVM